jgi:hypothetical protein
MSRDRRSAHYETTISASNAEGRQLQVRFFRLGDRYAHCILFVEREQETVILESVEGGDDDQWPPSPPLQQLTAEDRPDGRRVALLVGMAGRTHWSVSVEPHPSAAVVLFDAACRLQEEPSLLGSRYRCDVPLRLDEQTKTARLSVAGHDCRVLAEVPMSSDQALLLAEAERLAIRPANSDDPLPQTIRWRYRIEIVAEE